MATPRRGGILDAIISVEVKIAPDSPLNQPQLWEDHGDHAHRVRADGRLGPALRHAVNGHAMTGSHRDVAMRTAADVFRGAADMRAEADRQWPIFCERHRSERWPGVSVLITPTDPSTGPDQ